MSDAGTVLLFSYGTLQQSEVQSAVFGRLLDGSADALPGFRQTPFEILDPEVIRISGKRFHTMVQGTSNPNDEVQGTVFSISPAELAAADAYEVSDYRRVRVRLRSGREAWVYVKA